MKHLKLFEDNKSIPLLCVSIDTNFAKDKFTIGKLYYAAPKIFKKMSASFDYTIMDDNGNTQGLFAMDEDEYICTIGGRFTKDKSIEDYNRRMTTQRFDL